MEENIITSIIEKFGAEKQIIKTIEEMAELTKELAKNLNGNNNMAEVVDEIADVQIMLWQMIRLFSCKEQIDLKIHSKLKRTKERYNL